MSDQSPYDSETLPPPANPASRWEDFIDIFYAPASVFARRASSGWGLPTLVVTVLLSLIFLANMGVMQPIMDAEMTRGMASAMRKNPQLTPEMVQNMRAVSEKFARFAVVFVVVTVPITIFFTGLFLWVVGKFFDAKQTFGAALMVTAYSFLPRVVESVLNGIEGLLMNPANLTGRYQLSLGVGRFLDPDGSPVLLAALGRIDVFTIWITILLGIGLAVTGKIPRQKAFVAAAMVWVIGGLFAVLTALRNS
jgi:hypothetical protein